MEYDFFETDFKKIFHSGGIFGALTTFIHNATEKKFGKKAHFEKVLEIGGNSGKHLESVRHSFSEYYINDIKSYDLLPTALNYFNSGKLKINICDAENLELPDHSFDRVIIVCVLHHCKDPEKMLLEARRVLKSRGVLTIYLPCDPGIIYRLCRKIVTIRKDFNNLKYSLINAREHRNHYHSLNILIDHVFKSDQIIKSKRPFPYTTWNLNIYTIYNIRKTHV